jgi:hypothetical protein
MAKKWRKQASEMTTDEVLNRVFGKGAAKRLRKALDAEDERKPARKAVKKKNDQPRKES